jgi:lipopolysaccharide transport system permease protein
MSEDRQIKPHSRQTGSVLGLAHSLYRHRQLIYTLARKDILGRYKGALMGISWTLITPIFTLIIYTFIFSEIFKIRWHESAGSSSKLEFALIIFAGMIVFTFFSEIINRSTTIISSNVNYVKKVIFPLEILPAVLLLEAGFYAFISLVTLLLLIFITNVGTVNNIYFVPIIFATFAFLCL